MEDMEELKKDLKELTKNLQMIGASVSKMESAIFDSIVNGNYGMLKRVFDLDERVTTLENWQEKKDLLSNLSKEETIQKHGKYGVISQWIAAIAATIALILSVFNYKK